MNRIGLLSFSIWAVLLCLSSSTLCSSLYDKFVKCGVPVHCGKVNVSYPFYVDGLKPSYCGHPGFNVSCSNNADFPLTISSTFYAHGPDTTTYDINPYNSFGFHILNKAILNIDETCTIPKSKQTDVLLTTSRPQSRTNYYLYGGCTKPLPSNLAWSSTPNCSDPILLIPRNDMYSGYAEMECVMRIPLSLDSEYDEAMFVPTAEGGRATNWSTYRTAARRGLFVMWLPGSSCVTCWHSGGICGYYQDGFKCFCSDGAYPSTCGDSSSNNKMVKPLGFSIGGLTFIAIVIIMILSAKKRRENSKIISDLLRKNECFTLKRYNYWEIKKITGSFKDKLGQGGFGSVYKGVLKDGRQVAVKILSSTESSNDGQDFINEVASISRTAHVNIVGLIGFCISGSKRALIYPFMPNGSLEKFIYDEKLSGPRRSLEWGQLHSIAVGIARGLEYLHCGCTTRILHFDIKPHNILLDGDFCPKISDFGLAKVCKHKESVVSTFVARGTVGYIAPEQVCRNFGRVSHKSDVYSYGMMILEMVGGRKNIDDQNGNASEIYFPHWIYKRLLLDQELELNGIVDEDDRVRARKMIITGLWCIQTDPAQRPPIGRVVEMLQGSIELLPVPPKPYMYSPLSSPQHILAPVLTSSTQTISNMTPVSTTTEHPLMVP